MEERNRQRSADLLTVHIPTAEIERIISCSHARLQHQEETQGGEEDALKLHIVLTRLHDCFEGRA